MLDHYTRGRRQANPTVYLLSNHGAALASDSSAANRGTGADTKKEAAEEMNAKFTDAMENLKFMEAMEAMGEPEKGRGEFRTSSNHIPVVFFGLLSVYMVELSDANNKW